MENELQRWSIPWNKLKKSKSCAERRSKITHYDILRLCLSKWHRKKIFRSYWALTGIPRSFEDINCIEQLEMYYQYHHYLLSTNCLENPILIFETLSLIKHLIKRFISGLKGLHIIRHWLQQVLWETHQNQELVSKTLQKIK